jgi:DNA polymerase-1
VNKLLLVDGNSLINRAYYATTLSNGATFGFINMFLRAVEQTGVTNVAVAFDMRAKTFRHQMYDQYKANRRGMPDDLAAQLNDLKKILTVMGVQMFEKSGFEADDIIGTIAQTAGERGYHTIILTGDKDAFQLVSKNTEVNLTRTGVTNMEIYDVDRIFAEYGVSPKQLIDIKALMGDKSDNIPGAKNVGEKTAVKVIKEFGTVENSPYNTDEMVIKSKILAAIKCDVEIDIDFKKLGFKYPLTRDVFLAFKTRNFNSFLRRSNLWDEDTAPKTAVQQSFL